MPPLQGRRQGLLLPPGLGARIAAVPLIDTTAVTSGTVITNQEILGMPTSPHVATLLAVISPGVVAQDQNNNIAHLWSHNAASQFTDASVRSRKLPAPWYRAWTPAQSSLSTRDLRPASEPPVPDAGRRDAEWISGTEIRQSFVATTAVVFRETADKRNNPR